MKKKVFMAKVVFWPFYLRMVRGLDKVRYKHIYAIFLIVSDKKRT
jgi:hypothetical protein